MIRKQTIEKTAVCYWSDEDDLYVAESPLFPRTAGIGDTAQSARRHFEKMLNEIYGDLACSRVRGYNKRGRPAKGGVAFNTKLQPESKLYIDELADSLGISQGEVIDYLTAFHKSKTLRPKPAKSLPSKNFRAKIA